jgi:hypothetical protein
MVGLRDAKRGALVVVCVMAVSSPPGLGTTEASGQASAEPTIAGVVADGYHGAAYPVPRHRQPGPHVNDVRVEPLNDSTDRGTPTLLPAGQPVAVRPHEGDHDRVEVEITDGVWAVGDRRDFWVIPQFATLGDLTLMLGGQPVSLGQAHLASYPGSLDELDDPRTAEFDAVSFPVRLFLDCKSDDWSIANQKFAGDVLASGIYADDAAEIDGGLAGLDWGVAQRVNKQGVFELDRDCDDAGSVPDFGETHHTMQWLESMGRAVYVLAASRYAGEFRPKIDSYVDHIEKLARILTKEEVRSHWRDAWAVDAEGKPYTSKFFMRGAALALAASLTNDEQARREWNADATKHAREGLSYLRENGVAPQKGGFDVRYQMSAAYLAEVHASLLADGDLRNALDTSIEHMVSWMMTRIDDQSGRVDVQGSTRTCAGPGSEPFSAYLAVYGLLIWVHAHPEADHLLDIVVLLDERYGDTSTSCS